MRVLLIEPPALFLAGSGHTRQVAPLGLAYVASALAAEHDVRLLLPDTRAYTGPDPWGELASAIAGEAPDMVGITLVTAALTPAARLTKLVREHVGPVPVVIGGPHPTADPAGALAITGADYAVLGEGEEAMAQLARLLDAPMTRSGSLAAASGEVPGVAWLGPDGLSRISPPRPPAADLDRLAWPLRGNLVWPEDIHPSFYQGAITARGCLSSCIYCAARLMNGGRRGMRYRSVGGVTAEIRHLRESHGVNHVFFHDSLFTADRRRTLELCASLAECQITFDCQTRADFLDRDLLRAMAAGGCRHIMLGVESGDPQTLRRIRRPVRPDAVAPVVAAIRDAGIRATGFFMVGWPWDDARSMRATADYAMSLGLNAAFLFSVTPLPGTELWQTSPISPVSPSTDFREPMVNLTAMRDAAYRETFGAIRRRLEDYNRATADKPN